MADQLFTANREVVPFIGLPDVDRTATGLPWGMCVHRGNQAIAAAAGAGEKLQLDLPLPTNYVSRLAMCIIDTQVNSGINGWVVDPQMRIYYAPVEQPQVFPAGYTTLNVPFVAGGDYSFTLDPLHQVNYTPGINMVAGSGADVKGAATAPFSAPNMLITSIPAGVGTQEPAFRVWSTGAIDSGSVNYLLIWHLFTIEQRNHVLVNYQQQSNPH